MPGIVGLITRMPAEQAARELYRRWRVCAMNLSMSQCTRTYAQLAIYAGGLRGEAHSQDGMPLANEREIFLSLFPERTFRSLEQSSN